MQDTPQTLELKEFSVDEWDKLAKANQCQRIEDS